MIHARSAILGGIAMFVLAHVSQAQTINISLNLHYNDSADPALGGNWTLVAKTDGVNGIAGIDALLSNINIAGAAYQPGIGAVTNGGSPFIGTFGGAVDVVYFQDLSTPGSVVTNVGRGPGTPGNLPLDPLNDPAWDNAARIVTGTFSAVRPTFTSVGPQSTDGNVLSSAIAPFSVFDAAVTVVVRDVIVGDYNRNGAVDAADYVTWRETLGMVGPGLPADGSGNNIVDVADLNVWRRGFGLSGGAAVGAGSGLAATSTIPEPASVVTVLLMLTIGMLFHRRRRTCNTVARLTAPALRLAFVMGTAERAHALPRARISGILAAVAFLSAVSGSAIALDRTWIGGNVDWVDAGVATNWNPNDEPDADDRAIFNTANAVNLGSNNTVNGLALSGGIDLFTNDFDLTVDGFVEVAGAATNLFIRGSAGSINADDVTIDADGTIEMRGGTLPHHTLSE